MGIKLAQKMDAKRLARLIDHTNLEPTTTPQDIQKMVHEAVNLDFKCIYVVPDYFKIVQENSDLEIGTPIAFPFGNIPTKLKLIETEHACTIGANWIDPVIDIASIKNGNHEKALDELTKIVDLAHSYGVGVKPIIGTNFLTPNEIQTAAKLVVESRADYIKTASKWGPRPVSLEDILTIKSAIGESIKIKAAGGVTTIQEVIELFAAGATRIGTSKGLDIVKSQASSLTIKVQA